MVPDYFKVYYLSLDTTDQQGVVGTFLDLCEKELDQKILPSRKG